MKEGQPHVTEDDIDKICSSVIHRLATMSAHRQGGLPSPPPSARPDWSDDIKALLIRRLTFMVDDYLSGGNAAGESVTPRNIPRGDDAAGYTYISRGGDLKLPLPLYHAARPPGVPPAFASVMSVLAGFGLMLVSCYSWFGFVRDPVSGIVQIYLSLFGGIIVLLEGSVLPGHVKFLSFIETWCKLLCRPFGAGLFLLFVGVLSLSFYQKSVMNLGAGSVLTLVGLFRIHTSSWSSLPPTEASPATGYPYMLVTPSPLE